MKLGIFGDLHFTNKSPVRRLDDYFTTQLNKFNQGLDIFEKEECTHIFQVGDFFDAPTASNYVISTIISLLKNRDIVIYCCYGQHDIAGHAEYTLRRSPLKVLESAGVVKILDSTPIEFPNPQSSDNDKRYVKAYASSFGTEVPKTNSDDPYKLLVTHRMIGDRQLYPDQELPSPREFLKANPKYSIILCGDYHYRFIDTYQGRTIINPGCIVRKSINKFDLEHEPAVVTFDVDINESKVHILDFKPVEEIFDLETKGKKDNEVLLKFVENLKKENTTGTNWKNILLKVLKERKCSVEVRDLIDKAMETKE